MKVEPHHRKKSKPPKLEIARYKLAHLTRKATSYKRVLPDFLIIGAAKAGTTSLYNYLLQHPQVAPCFRKEVHYFDRKYNKGLKWYKSHFPLSSEMNVQLKMVTGESSPYYLYHPLAAERVSKTLPSVRLFCMLRNPIDRAISNYNHRVRAGFESLPIEEAFAIEKERISGENLKLINNPEYVSYNHYHFSYITRGYYAEQLENWFSHISKDQILILNSEQFYTDPATAMKKAFNHLALPWNDRLQFKVFNSGGENYVNVSDTFRKNLVNHYKPYNEKLFELIGERYDWQ